MNRLPPLYSPRTAAGEKPLASAANGPMERKVQDVLSLLGNIERLSKCTPQALIAETLANGAAEHLVVVELMNRVLPGWENAPLGTYDEPSNPSGRSQT